MVRQGATRMHQVFVRCYASQVPQVISSVPSVPVIRIPNYVKKYVEKAREKQMMKTLSLQKRIAYRGDTRFPVISSTDKLYNFYLGQIYRENYPLPLQSKFWFKKKSSGQKFTIHPWDSNPSLPVLCNKKHENEVGFPRTFSELLTDENLLLQLKNKGFESPTPVQVLTIPPILERKHLLLAAETGCGKTVSYLAPIIQNITKIKKSTKLFTNTPLALIIAPGIELAEQIGAVAYDLCRNSDLNVRVLVTKGTRQENLKLTEEADVDILVASIGTLSKLVKRGYFKLTNLRHCVLDEADTLMDDSFLELTLPLLRQIPMFLNSVESIRPEDGTQLILASSTYPMRADEVLVELFEPEDLVKIKSPYLHRVLPHVKQQFWRLNHDNRPGVLLDLVKSDYEKKIPVLIFSNHSPSCDWMSLFLESNGVPNVKLHGGLTPGLRAKYFKEFTSGLTRVMCATDLASRGLDMQHVRHVINFDFPTSVSDYILRAGRVGRVGSNHGYVTNFVVEVPGVHTVQEIEKAVRCCMRIPYVDANIKRKITKLYFSHKVDKPIV